MSQPRYLMIGGFLGAGKTTAILGLAERLRGQGLRVGLITNDQSYGLVDTGRLAAHSFPIEEITGGCFCCRFNSLIEASQRLSDAARPEVFLAEPVGSCTDLKATVDYPLRRMYGDSYSIAPLSVLIDPLRARCVLGLAPGKSFSQKVIYIYGKQLEEAELIVINKIDLLPPASLQALQAALEARYPQAKIHAISASNGAGMDDWLGALMTSASRTQGAMQVDYDTYAEGEALLGWVNAMWKLDRDTAWDGNEFLMELAKVLQGRLAAEGLEVAHLKMTLAPHEGNDLAVVNLVQSNRTPETSHRLQEPLERGELVLNLRAEGPPESLRDIVLSGIARLGEQVKLDCDLMHIESFRPGRPTPTHRLTAI